MKNIQIFFQSIRLLFNLQRSSLVVWLLLLLAVPAPAPAQQRLTGHVPAVVAGLQSLGLLPATNHLQLAIGLPARQPEALTQLLREIYDPASPNYHHYLTPEQFTEQFGPAEADYQAVIAFARQNGLTVTATHPNRLLVDVNGTVADIQKAFHVTLRTYQHPTENRTFYAPDTEPTVDLTVPLLHISGLDDYGLPRPNLVARPLSNGANAAPDAGSGPGGTYMGQDFRAAYVPDSSLNGSGQVVGLLQYDGYTPSDIAYYETAAGLPGITLSNVLIDGASGLPSGDGGEVEVSLDIEMVISMATNVSQVTVYEAANPSPFVDILSRMASDNVAKQLSCSWYISGGTMEPAADVIFQEMAVQGQSFFSASGDDDAYTGLINFPSDTPYITEVGGTTLTTSGPRGSWVSETVWNWDNGIGSGGGISTQYPIPWWQTNASMTANQGSTTMRNVPDVALTANNVYVRADGYDYNVGGTSCASPLWAGFIALVNQQAVGTGKATVGFINPAVYAIGASPNYASAFHDITTGNNTSSSSPTKFYAVPGYDLCTGWGTPAGQSLINALANPEALIITPASGFSSVGGAGGPFTVTSQSLTLTNAGTNILTWSLSNTSAWLNASPSNGMLNPGGPATTVAVSLNSGASNLVVGSYSATLWFTNLNDRIGQSRQYNLSVISPPTITMQPTNEAVIEGTAAGFTVSATGGLPLVYQWQDNGTNLTDGGGISGSATTNLVITSVSMSNVGIYTVIASNAAGVAVSSNVSLTIIPSPPVIVMQPTNQTVYLGMTARFSVAVVGTTPYSYQWSFNETNLLNATNNLLVLTNAQFDQAGDYAVMVTNIHGATNSATAVLTVNPPPPCLPVPSGITAWWPADGNANDIIGTNNGVPVGNLTYTNGEVGEAFVFDGSTSYIPLPASPSLNIGSGSGFTIECWVNPSPANGPGDGGPLIEWDSVSTDGAEFWVQGDFSLFTNVKDTSGNGHTLTTAPGVVSANVWQHVALTYDQGSGWLLIYTNGAVAASENIGSFTPQTTYPVNLGRRTGQPIGNGDTYAGFMDELSLYNRALSSNEIAAIYNAGSAGKCPPAPTPPLITTQPANQTVAAGGTANFSVVVAGTLPLSYQWTFNGTNLIGATNNLLVLSDVQFTQAGPYAVAVTNLYGSINSSNALLTVIPAPPCDPAPAGIVAWWPADGNADDIIGTNNGYPTGGITYTNGEVGQAFVFNGSTSYIPIPASPSLNIGSGSGFTIECWIQPWATAAAGGPLIEWDSASTDGTEFWVQGNNSIFVLVKDTSGNGHEITTAPGVVSTNTWQHVALTYNQSSGSLLIYTNGSVADSANFGSFTPQTTYAVNLGRRTGQPIGDGDTYNGLMDELSLYNRALSSNEIAAIYNAGSAGKCPPASAAPYIITQPTNQTVAAGGTASFSVAAGGAPPLAYQWTFNGTNLIGATNNLLVLSDVQFTQAGPYAIAVTNLYGSINSSNALLTVIPAPPCDPAPSGIVAWWPANGNADDIIGTNNGYPTGGLSYTNGEVGQAFVFNGITSYIPIPASPSLNLGTGSGLTIECWIAPWAAHSGDGGPMIEWDSASTDGAEFWVQGNNSLFTNIKDTSGNGHELVTAAGVVQTNTWQHVALTYDESSGWLRFYTNGVMAASVNVGSFTPQTTYPVNLGRRTGQPIGNGDTYNGLMDELSLYNRALSSNEIAAIYNAGSAGKCPPSPPAPPTIETQPTNQTVLVGGTVNFKVVAGGTLPLDYQWTFDGTNLFAATNTLLTLTNLQFWQVGTYAVLVTNLYGATMSSNALLVVNPYFHFVWNPIPSPRFAGAPFAVTVQAQNPTNGLATNFTGTVVLVTTNGAPVSPGISGNFSQGAWAGTVTIAQPGTNLMLEASDSYGENGLANPINVVSLPALGAVPSGGTLYISWPMTPSGFVLETSPNLMPGSWVPVSAPPVPIGDQNLEPITITDTNAFYRLRFTGP